MKYSDTQFMRALGMVLIINSHLYQFYPIPYIGTGGALGNSIFFCLSAFGIHLSQKKKHKTFSLWFSNRISRIYPSMWIVHILIALPIVLVSGRMNDAYVMTFIGQLFNPRHWFIRALLVYYLLSFFLLGDEKRVKLYSVFALSGVLYFVIYFTYVDLSKWTVEDTSIKLIHYFMIFLFGIYLASKSRSIVYTGKHNYFILLFLIVIVYGHKILMTKGLYSEFQFVQQVPMYPIVLYLLKISRSPFVSSLLTPDRKYSSLVKFISDHTLELYILQETIYHPVLKLNFSFPLNAVTFILLICLLSTMVKRFAQVVRKKVR